MSRRHVDKQVAALSNNAQARSTDLIGVDVWRSSDQKSRVKEMLLGIKVTCEGLVGEGSRRSYGGAS